MADRRLNGVERRCWLRGDGLRVLREEAGGVRKRRGGRLCCRRSSRGGRGVLKRLIDRWPSSSRQRVLVDLGVGWEAHRKFC